MKLQGGIFVTRRCGTLRYCGAYIGSACVAQAAQTGRNAYDDANDQCAAACSDMAGSGAFNGFAVADEPHRQSVDAGADGSFCGGGYDVSYDRYEYDSTTGKHRRTGSAAYGGNLHARRDRNAPGLLLGAGSAGDVRLRECGLRAAIEVEENRLMLCT